MVLFTGGACSGSPASTGDDAGSVDDAPAVSDALVSLDPTPGHYLQTCDGSGAVALDFLHFIDANDENQGLRVYSRAASGPPVQQVDISAGLGLTAGDEADLEDLARIGDRIYAITSHGRDKNGVRQAARYRFAAIDLAGTAPATTLAVAGSASTLLADLLDSANWDAPDPTLIAALDTSSQLARASVATLAPENQGTNIEGLSALPDGQLAIGFRNPRPGGRAIVVTLTNPDALAAGQPAHFGGAAQLDLGGLGIRGMAWSSAHAAVLILAGSHTTGGPFRIYRWSGALDAAPVVAADVIAPASSAPEAVVPYPGTKDVQILFDQGDVNIAGVSCKDTAVANRGFTDVIVHVD